MSSTHNFLIDENLPSKLAKRMSDIGYTATSVALCGLIGQPDHLIFRYACTRKLVIITSDSDFLKSSFFPPPHAGIVVLQFPHKTRIAVITSSLLANLAEIDALDLNDHFYIVEPTGVRFSA